MRPNAKSHLVYRRLKTFFYLSCRSDKDGDRPVASSIKGIKTLDDLEDWLSEHSKDNSPSKKINNDAEGRNSLISSSSDMTGTASAWDELYDRLRATGEIDVENGTHVWRHNTGALLHLGSDKLVNFQEPSLSMVSEKKALPWHLALLTNNTVKCKIPRELRDFYTFDEWCHIYWVLMCS